MGPKIRLRSAENIVETREGCVREVRTVLDDLVVEIVPTGGDATWER